MEQIKGPVLISVVDFAFLQLCDWNDQYEVQGNISARKDNRLGTTITVVDRTIVSWVKEKSLHNIETSRKYSGDGRHIIVKVCNREMSS